jgi:hypothetical protein
LPLGEALHHALEVSVQNRIPPSLASLARLLKVLLEASRERQEDLRPRLAHLP